LRPPTLLGKVEQRRFCELAVVERTRSDVPMLENGKVARIRLRD
jgi:hypothetical protein